MKRLSVVLSTVADAAAARDLARRLVEERLAACVNVVAGVTSFYRWRGEIHEDAEVLLLAKVQSERFDAFARRLAELHPYEVPEIVELPAERVSESYLAWAWEQTRD